jgi:hypothetical protein
MVGDGDSLLRLPGIGAVLFALARFRKTVARMAPISSMLSNL